MRPPNTAKPGKSIWDNVGRKIFERDLDALDRTGFVPARQTLEEKEWLTPRKSDILPFPIEKQLSNDFAFISAYEYGAYYVTAATVQADKAGGMIVRLTANDGIRPPVGEALGRIFSNLEKCSKKDLPREQCSEDLLDIIVDLNRNRILGRLGSIHFKAPKHERGRAISPLTTRLKQRLASTRLQSSADGRDIRRQIEALEAAFLQVESTSGVISALKSAVKAAFQLTGDGLSLSTRLTQFSCPNIELDSREIHEVTKLASYWRICINLAHLSRSYRPLFSTLRLETLEPYQKSSVPGSKIKRCVHAEIQMIIFYETSQVPVWPRVIGVSKEACFLCNSFVRTHKRFYLSKAHCRVFPLWTVPDLAQYSLETLRRLRKTLVGVHRNIQNALNQAKSDRTLRPFPLQSSIDLHKPIFPTPSMTTVQSSLVTVKAQSPSPETLTPAHPPSEVKSARPSRSSLSLAAPQNRIDSPIAEEPESLSPPVGDIESVPTSPPAAQVRLDWLNLYVEFEPGVGSTANVSLDSTMNIEVAELPIYHLINAKNFAPGDEIVLSRRVDSSIDEARPGMNITLINSLKNPLVIRCKW